MVGILPVDQIKKTIDNIPLAADTHRSSDDSSSGLLVYDSCKTIYVLLTLLFSYCNLNLEFKLEKERSSIH